MNDRYLYRAKRKNWRELPREKWWVTGYLVNKKCGEYNTVGFEEFKTMIIVTSFSDGGIEWCYIDEDTLCQCTGLKDKNGKLIWESDVVRKVDTNALGYHRERICTVSYEKSGYWNIITTLGDGYWIGEFEKEQLEVIGNKFDNQELLEVGE